MKQILKKLLAPAISIVLGMLAVHIGVIIMCNLVSSLVIKISVLTEEF